MVTLTINLTTVIVTVISMLITIHFARLSAKNADINRKIQAVALQDQCYANVREWASRVVDHISKAVHLCDLDPAKCSDFFERRHKLQSEFSSLLDIGRWFFPNVREDEIGQYKEPAYRGLRQKSLDLIHEAYCHVQEIDYTIQTPNPQKRKELVETQRNFVAEIQEFLDPRKYQKELDELLLTLDDQKT